MKTHSIQVWDVIVIGGGPAGMMAAIRASELGKSVLLLEKNPSLGKKLLITGGGRCNLTNNKQDLQSLVSSYKGRPKALFSAFSQFGVEDTLEFFHSRGLQTKVEAESRVFPITDKAESVWQVLLDSLKKNRTQIKTSTVVDSIEYNRTSKLFSIKSKYHELTTKSCIVSTGGTSRPETGSTGDGFGWLKKLGHTITENNLALVPVSTKESWTKRLAGVSLKDVRISIVQDSKRQSSKLGKILFTHVGLSGPTILNMSSQVGELLQHGEATIEVDLLPHTDNQQLKSDLYQLLESQNNKIIKNSLKSLVPSTLVSILLELADINPSTPNHSLSKEKRKNLIKTIKSLQFTAKGLLGSDKAVVSSGGVDIKEVNFQTMESRIIPGLYIVGDLLNIDRPSGGYSLQICWSTGFVAGQHC